MKLPPQHYASHIGRNLRTLSTTLHRVNTGLDTIRVRIHLLGYTELHAHLSSGRAPEHIHITPDNAREMYEGLRGTQDMLAIDSSDLSACCESLNGVRGVLEALIAPRRGRDSVEGGEEEGGISWPGLEDSIADHERILRNQGMKYQEHLRIMMVTQEVMGTGAATEDELKVASELCTEFMNLAERYLWSLKDFRACCDVVADVKMWLEDLERWRRG
ncbi:uncharacterized protein H6S33_008108 [Morchella sextelata]|uniref:uncharacterized protein n=1 Tax=Morchella sextelata TaxID=1174677 RepID=UPI001D056117|nr:uncharacterized protein H6S33_008108 [Morchella sextelata]KAH0603104.1 hypothetical protein H6S33_008108 [Morchella sextelata]